MEKEEDRLYSILKRNKNGLLSLNNNIIVEIITIEVEMEQYLKQTCQKNIARISEAQVDKRRSKVTGLEECSSQGDEQGASNGRRYPEAK